MAKTIRKPVNHSRRAGIIVRAQNLDRIQREEFKSESWLYLSRNSTRKES